MADEVIWAVLALLVLFGIFASIVLFKKRRDCMTDYYAFFIMGISWVPFGILMMTISPESFVGKLFFVLGLIYLGIGLSHKKDWKKNRCKLSKRVRIMKFWIVAGLLLFLLIGLSVFYFVSGEKVSSFEECVAAGNAVMESYPRQCESKGEVFVEDVGRAKAEVSVDILPGEVEEK